MTKYSSLRVLIQALPFSHSAFGQHAEDALEVALVHEINLDLAFFAVCRTRTVVDNSLRSLRATTLYDSATLGAESVRLVLLR